MDQLFDGKYKIITTIGEGGTSTVYLAQNIKLGTLWAIKQIHKPTNHKMDLLAEPNILKRLNHPALPRIFDIVEHDEYLYIIEDYVEGISLERELENEKRFSEERVLDWCKQLCEVLLYLHTLTPNPIIFRDIKPANIILTYDEKIKLVDFGIAREYKATSGNDTAYMGTRGYAAPEQYGGMQSDARTDIYSLGVTLYHLLTGNAPNVPPYEIKPVRQISETYSRDIEYLISRCTEQDPNKRFQSVEEILLYLEHMQQSETELLTPKQDENVISEEAQINKTIVFKKIIFTVWGCAEFAAELSMIAAHLSSFDVLTIDFDFTAQKLDCYMNIQHSNIDTFEDIIAALNQNKLSKEKFKNASIQKDLLENLYILSSNYDIENYQKYREINIDALIQSAYRYFDICIINVNTSIFDIYTIEALKKADYILIPINPSIDNIRVYRTQTAYMQKKHNISIDQVRYIAFEYKKNVSPSIGDIKNEVGHQKYLGHISYQPERENLRNYNVSFAEEMQKRYIDEYVNILSKFNIVPNRKIPTRILDWLRI